MKLPTKSRYGTRAIIEIARRYGKAPIKRKEIVESQQIPDSYLENILIALKNNGIIDTIRGANGGYFLRTDPSNLTVLQILEALEGSLAPVSCVDNPKTCERIDKCLTRDVWKEMHEAQINVLSKTTIQDLLNKKS